MQRRREKESMPSPASRPKMPKSLVRSAVQAMGMAIVDGTFEPGAVLPNEEALGLRYGLSRSGLREAIKVLSGKGLVRTARRYGSRVCLKPEWNYLDPDVLTWHLADPANLPQFLSNIREMRVLLEPVAAVMAAQRATRDDMERIAELAATLPLNPREDSIETDVAYHLAIMRASGNLIIAGLCPAMEVLMRAYLVSMWRLRPGPPLVDGAMNGHLLTAEAIAARDPAAARRHSEQMLVVTSLEIDRVLRQLDAPAVTIGRPAALPGMAAAVTEISAMFAAA